MIGNSSSFTTGGEYDQIAIGHLLLSDDVWKPMGAEADTTWSLDEQATLDAFRAIADHLEGTA